MPVFLYFEWTVHPAIIAVHFHWRRARWAYYHCNLLLNLVASEFKTERASKIERHTILENKPRKRFAQGINVRGPPYIVNIHF